MIVNIASGGNSACFRFSREDHDKSVYGRARAGQAEFEVWLPEEVEFDAIHPDLLALAAILVVIPWVTRRIVFEGSVQPSEHFAVAVRRAFGLKVVGWNADLSPRKVLSGQGKPCLAYSAGVDSTAALALMPEETELVFLNRVAPGRGPLDSNYRNDFAMHAVAALRGLGRRVHVVDSDLEYTRRPVGFPVDWSNAVPAVLLADWLDLRSIAWGMVLESAYSIGGHAFADWNARAVSRNWGQVFSAASLPMSPVVAGLSEVCTTKVVMGSPYFGIAQSCIRGTVDMPCGECPKCFRKGLLESAIRGGGWNEAGLAKYYRSGEIQAVLRDYPIKHENVLGYLLSHYHGNDHVLCSMQRRLRVADVDYGLFERFYPPYLQCVPDADRGHTTHALAETGIEPMTAAEMERLRGWKVPDLSSDPILQAEQGGLIDQLAAYHP